MEVSGWKLDEIDLIFDSSPAATLPLRFHRLQPFGAYTTSVLADCQGDDLRLSEQTSRRASVGLVPNVGSGQLSDMHNDKDGKVSEADSTPAAPPFRPGKMNLEDRCAEIRRTAQAYVRTHFHASLTTDRKQENKKSDL